MIYEFNQWLFSRPEVYTPYNNHYGLTAGDETYWDSWETSPVFPWNEQPESDKFYVVYSTKESKTKGRFWETKVYFEYMIFSNNIKLLNDVFKAMVDTAGKHEYSTIEFDKWLVSNNDEVDGYVVQDMHFEQATDVVRQEQENGVFGKAVRFCVVAHDC